MILVPLTRDQANAFVRQHHRHCKRFPGHRAALGLEVADQLVGVVVLARPCRALQANRFLVEIVRLCVAPDAPRNACSWLYARARRCAATLGFRLVTTCTLTTESGASLRGAGFQPTSMVAAKRKGYDTPSRRRNALPTDGQQKIRWTAACA